MRADMHLSECRVCRMFKQPCMCGMHLAIGGSQTLDRTTLGRTGQICGGDALTSGVFWFRLVLFRTRLLILNIQFQYIVGRIVFPPSTTTDHRVIDTRSPAPISRMRQYVPSDHALA